MAITELALLHLKTHPELTPTIKSALESGASAQAKFSSHPVHLYTQLEDPSYIYLLGGWQSVSQHMTEWIPSQTNQAIMASLAAEIEVVWMFHIDIEPQSEETAAVTNPLNAPVVAIARYFIPQSSRWEFDETFTEVENLLQRVTAPRLLRAGYRVDDDCEIGEGEGEEEMMKKRKKKVASEFVMFTGWETVQDHLGFAQSDAFKEFGKTRQYMVGADIRHARLLGVVSL
ncbi:hypothetical protein FE257_003287 [Aspergillus nanangensis]|uniref:ABM domain-containing protein n=1 Tax=Aspergillus nanangensis TaxID=2582783 RepID=A0AAD4GWF7_ASPNN|nr:hypothetical protein FE257_003287 [Aspergillus nanangensis]